MLNLLQKPLKTYCVIWIILICKPIRPIEILASALTFSGVYFCSDHVYAILI